jgi:hypothetical protein
MALDAQVIDVANATWPRSALASRDDALAECGFTTGCAAYYVSADLGLAAVLFAFGLLLDI